MTDSALSLEQLVAALARKGVPLPFEIGTFLVLESCERVLGKSLLITAADVWLGPDGEVAIATSQRAGSEQEAGRSLVVLLGELLVRSAPGVPPLLLELVERSASDRQLTLGGLRDALEASLVPLNRAAMRRVLGRLLREARKEGERSSAKPDLDEERLDDELDALLGLPSHPKPKPSEPPPSERPQASPVPAAWRALAGDDQLVESPAPRTPSRTPARSAPRSEPPLSLNLRDNPGARELDIEPTTPRAPAMTRAGRQDVRESPSHLADELEPIPPDGPSGSGKGLTRVGIISLLLALAVGGAYLGLGREGTQRLLGMQQGEHADAPPAASAPTSPVKVRYGELRVSSSPARAQVLLLIGRSPALAAGLPVGVAHELVAVSEGRKVARDVVPSDAAWTETNGALQYELALQLAEGKAGSERELGPTRLPQAPGAPTGATGAVRVITSPPGAQVYQLIGFTPDVRVENLEVAQPAELLVYLAGYEPARITLTEQSYKLDAGRLVADLDVPLVAGK